MPMVEGSLAYGMTRHAINPLGMKIRYTWYDHGKVKEKFDASGDQDRLLVSYFYDRSGNITTKRYADGREETFGYYPDGRLKTAANEHIGYSYGYYANGWLKSVSDTAGRTVTYDRYDGLGQKQRVTVWDGAEARTITYGYDEANRPRTVTSTAGTFTYGYDPLGRRSSLTYPHQLIATYGYDDLGRLTSLGQSGASLPQFGYGHDQAGNRIARTGTDNASYGYDDLYRLTRAITPGGTENYSYDAVGNRLTGPGAKDTAYRYNSGNQMIHGRILGYLYDNAGNQTTRTVPNAPTKGWTLTWDQDNRLSAMEQSKGEERQGISFRYDPLGRRIGKTVTITKGGVTRSETTTYVYDGDNIVLEIYADPKGVVEKTWYTHGPQTDEHLALERGGDYYYYHADGLGSIVAITDTRRTVIQSYRYDSFGVLKAATGFRNSYTYTGREWDREAGLYFYRARYYDPMEGRFISKDPIGFEGGDVNLYGYVQNNPVNFTDPLGLFLTACTPRCNNPRLISFRPETAFF